MKKFLIAFVAVLLSASPVFAKNESASQQTSSQQYTITVSPSPVGSGVKNQNEIQTQNQGEENEVKTQNQEEEISASGTGEGLQNRNENALEHMSIVAQKVQELLQLRTTGGIGEQVRVIAQEQNQAQNKTQEEFAKFEAKGKLVKFLFGTDFGAVKNLQQLMEQNRLRIEELTRLTEQLSNQGDIALVQETIQALTAQNTALQEAVEAEEKIFSLFGWLAKFFVK